MFKAKNGFVGYRVLVNIGFWAYLAWGLMFLPGVASKFCQLPGFNLNNIKLDEIVKFADGELWFFQIVGGLLLLGGLRLARQIFPGGDYDFFYKKCARDDFYSIFLNFGSLYILSGLYLLGGDTPGALRRLLFGVINIFIYIKFSRFGLEERRVEKISDSNDGHDWRPRDGVEL